MNGLSAEEVDAPSDPVQSGFELFSSKSFKDKTTAINTIAESGSPLSIKVLSALLEGKIYYHKKSKDVVSIIEATAGNYEVNNPLTKESLGSMTKKELRKKYKKVGINNKLRTLLNEKLAALTIYSEDKSTRLNAARNMLKNPSVSTIEVLSEAVKQEKDAEVKELMEICIAAANTSSDDVELQLSSINKLSGSLYPEIRLLLENLDKKYSTIEEADERLKYIFWFKFRVCFITCSGGSCNYLRGDGRN